MKRMKINKAFSVLIIVQILFFTTVFAQIPPGYYDAAAGLTGQTLKNKLHDIISNGYNAGSYADLWTSYQTTDRMSNGKVWDMYSDIPGGTPPYYFTFITDQCGSYSGEGPVQGCYNREHSVPASWFNDAAPMYSDLFHVVPTDGYVNNRRSNYPFGDVNNASWTSQNGSKLGTSAVSGYTGTVFEPIDSFKGDFARIYFYMVTRYKDELPSWNAAPFSGSDFSTWAKNMFLQWDALDPVSAKEIQRNNKAYLIQNNRNPYVDHPEWVAAVWGPSSVVGFIENPIIVNAFPNPTNDLLKINISGSNKQNVTLSLIQLDGKLLIQKETDQSVNKIDLSGLSEGVYLLTAKSQNFYKVEKIIVLR